MLTGDDMNNRKAAAELIAFKMAEVYALISECEQIATKNDVSFEFDFTYGMGGTYYPDDGWNPSSQSC